MRTLRKKVKILKVAIFALIFAACCVATTIHINFIEKSPIAEDVAFKDLIIRASEKHSVPAALVTAIIHAESNFKPNARSYAKAKGLMQINPITQRHLGLKDAFNPEQNVDAGTRYLNFLLKKFDGNLKHAIAAYNAGPGAVSKYNGIPPYKETRKYVKKVLKYYNRYRGIQSPASLLLTWINIENRPTDA